VDANDPQRVAVALDTAKIGASPGPYGFLAFMSQDGGATWQPAPKIGPYVFSSLTSARGAIYASGLGVSASGAQVKGLWISHDDGRAWSEVGVSTPWMESALNLTFWSNPQTGELLREAVGDTLTLDRSEDGGASWTGVPMPNNGGGNDQQALAAPNGAGWRICLVAGGVVTVTSASYVACSVDLGTTWTSPSAPNTSQISKGKSVAEPAGIFAVADDGTLFATYDDMVTGIHLEMLSPGASIWTPLGKPPVAGSQAAQPTYTTGPGGGMLWDMTGAAGSPFVTAVYP
jgi:hypothetical protein